MPVQVAEGPLSVHVSLGHPTPSTRPARPSPFSPRTRSQNLGEAFGPKYELRDEGLEREWPATFTEPCGVLPALPWTQP